jgi:hypothetical protein
LKYYSSIEPEVRASACLTLKYLAKSLSDEDLKSKFLPQLKKLAQDPSEIVKSTPFLNKSLIIKKSNLDLQTSFPRNNKRFNPPHRIFFRKRELMLDFTRNNERIRISGNKSKQRDPVIENNKADNKPI